ncbi:MAG: aconitate hydratase AcnA [Chloroflexi bacterium]|nr:aconitate hydratase AcnA [Chloroflexota bacterium]
MPGAAELTYYYRLQRLEEAGVGAVSRLPFSIKVLLEALLRQVDNFAVTEDDVVRLARWDAARPAAVELPFKPARVIFQDFTAVPAVVDLAAMRGAMARLGGDPKRVNPQIAVDLVIDHSVQVDRFGSRFALLFNAEREFERNRERYEFLKWGQSAFSNFRVVPPATGIVHQVNLEYLATVVRQQAADFAGDTQYALRTTSSVIFPDTLVGADSHTTMVNGLGVLGWGVGGIEAEAVMLGQPIYMLTPQVVGFKLRGRLPEGATATDLVLTVTQMLRAKGVVDKFVEFYGPGLSRLSLPDRATIANMAPDYGATMGFFPVDAETLRYLALTGRPAELIDLVERYCRAQGLFRTDQTADPIFSDTLELDLGAVRPSLAGPRRPQDRVDLKDAPASFRQAFPALPPLPRQMFEHGAVVIAAITSCTNTSNSSVMIGAGLLAKRAVERGLKVQPWVKTSLAPGSKVVTSYLDKAGLTPYLEALGFHTVGYGCTTCIGNSGPLPDEIAAAIRENAMTVAAVISGNRNFEGRVHPQVRANYLASPMLVVAYALAGNISVDLTRDALGFGSDGKPVYLRDVWPSQEEIQAAIADSLDPEMFRQQYSNVYSGNDMWNQVAVAEAEMYAWDPHSTYVKEPPYFVDLASEPAPLSDIRGARALAMLGDSITTDHISPAGGIAANSPAGEYLLSLGVPESEFNQYGTRRGNHEVLMRGAFANIRIRNRLTPRAEGGFTVYQGAGARGQPVLAKQGESGEKSLDSAVMPIYDAAMKYQAAGIPTIVIAGKEYGTGSSRDWAAKGPHLLGVKAIIAESFERIHRSNLVGIGVLPLQFLPGQNAASLGLTGFETFDIVGIAGAEMKPKQHLTVRATASDGAVKTFEVMSRIDTPVEVGYYENGGILQTVLRDMLGKD